MLDRRWARVVYLKAQSLKHSEGDIEKKSCTHGVESASHVEERAGGSDWQRPGYENERVAWSDSNSAWHPSINITNKKLIIVLTGNVKSNFRRWRRRHEDRLTLQKLAMLQLLRDLDSLTRPMWSKWANRGDLYPRLGTRCARLRGQRRPSDPHFPRILSPSLNACEHIEYHRVIFLKRHKQLNEGNSTTAHWQCMVKEPRYT
ncbi:hypothetical protein BJ546DRAFT_653690 [Cryomyces antarcticus]